LRAEPADVDGEPGIVAPATVVPGAAPVRTRGIRRPLREQIATAALVQRLMLPDMSLPIGEFRLAALYRPCESFGGGFYDLAWSQNSALLLVADVMGHGLRSALITMLVKAAFQETASETSDPGALLAGMNARLQRTIPERIFVAAAVAKLDRQGAAIEIANAGLPHPPVVRAVGRMVEDVPVDALPIGLAVGLEAGAHDACRLRLEPRDAPLMATDGIGSITTTTGRCFEDRRLRQVLEGVAGRDSGDVIDRLIAAALKFSRGAALPDDVNLVVVSRQALVA
jgi:sigma-B regulation protein RsbU (phosphoserine phosphatase)